MKKDSNAVDNLKRSLKNYEKYIETITPKDTADTIQWQPTTPYVYKSDYNYKCPQCSGEYNTPSYKDGKYYCPFCSYEMLGM